MDKKECITIAQTLNPTTVEELLHNAKVIYAWVQENAGDGSSIAMPTIDLASTKKLFQAEQSRIKVRHKITAHKDQDDNTKYVPDYATDTMRPVKPLPKDEPINSTNGIYKLIQFFVDSGNPDPRPRDLIEAGANAGNLIYFLQQLEKSGKIRRIRLKPRHTVIRLIGEHDGEKA